MLKRGPKVVIITGKINSGKTTMMEKLFERKKTEGKSPVGIIARGVFRGKAKVGFDVVDLSTGSSMPLARIGREIRGGFSVGKFTFSNEGFQFAQKVLLNFKYNDIVFLDEVGPLELDGKGYANCLKTLLDSDISKLYIAVRSECLPEFMEKFFASRQVKVIQVEDTEGQAKGD
jgi:nucleoside-triphosphatase THEP1